MRVGRRGFTLIELLIVVVIIGILATIVTAKFSEARQRSAKAVIKASLRDLAIAQEIEHHTTGSYAGGSGPADYTQSPEVNISINEAGTTGWAATATHGAWPGKQCGIFVGQANPSNGAPATQEGVVECDP